MCQTLVGFPDAGGRYELCKIRWVALTKTGKEYRGHNPTDQHMGHIIIGTEMVGKRVRTVPRFQEKMARNRNTVS